MPPAPEGQFIVKFPGTTLATLHTYHLYRDCGHLRTKRPGQQNHWAQTTSRDDGEVMDLSNDLVELLGLTSCNACERRRITPPVEEVIADWLAASVNVSLGAATIKASELIDHLANNNLKIRRERKMS